MLILPAIDIINGQCVRLTKGDYNAQTTYQITPLVQAQEFVQAGASFLHIVDLDGAKQGKLINHNLIADIKKKINVPMQVGGGIRTYEDVAWYLNQGIDRVIIGTKALQDQNFLQQLLTDFGDNRIVVGLDILANKVASHGWLETSSQSYHDFATQLKLLGVKHLVVTDITKDGTLTEPNFALLQEIKMMGFKVIASGGVSDIASLKKLHQQGLAGAIIGKALYEGKINLPLALESVKPLSFLNKRIIPCLDIKNGRTVKGINFGNLQDAGDPVELAKKYAEDGADELVFLDISASLENRHTVVDLVKKVAKQIFIPFTVGGGINSAEDIRILLQNGADKISLNSSAVKNPQLIKESAELFGSQCIVVAIDIKKVANKYKVFIKGGTEETELEAVFWAKKVVALGAGEILLTSMDRDGTKQGFDLEILAMISENVNVPVIASGGAGTIDDIKNAFLIGKADAVLAASIFHYQEIGIKEIKRGLM